MDHQYDIFYVGNRGKKVGLEELLFAAVTGYPIRNVYAEIHKKATRTSFAACTLFLL
jgi:hypothetical protein